MTLIIPTNTTIPVQAWKSVDGKLQLSVGGQYAFLSREESARLAEYLDKFAKSED